MGLTIPESVFTKYYEIIDSTFDIFGVTCQLVSIEKKEEVVYIPDNNFPDRNSINDHKRGGGNRNRGNVTIKEVEITTDIKLKVYWDNKQWIRISENLVVPDASIQTIFFLEDLPKILRAKYLIVHKDIKEYKESRFERMGEHIPLGLRQNKYAACFWKRI
jgi:hypothetical protein